MKRWLNFPGVDARGPRGIFEEAFALGVLLDETTCLDFIEMRGLSSHLYDENEVSGLLAQLECFHGAFTDLLNKIDQLKNERDTVRNGEIPAIFEH